MSAPKRPEYIVEHMEEDEPGAPAHFAPWALLEYRHMLYHVGAGSVVHFTSLSKDALHALEKAFAEPLHPLLHPAKFELHTKSVLALAKERGWHLHNVCLLDPKAPHAISVADAGKHASSAAPKKDGPFTHFLFGGILGDDPPRDRTSSLRAHGFPGRHLGKIQMSTDTALGVTKRVVEDGLRLALTELDGEAVTGVHSLDKPGDGKGSLHFVDSPTVHYGRGESVDLPYRYLARDDNKSEPVMAPGMKDMIHRDFNRSLEF
ncbi:hypothetical protein MSPP1_002959 [Malassezia sp. CBS 17886]|nr:hypothetical protein MSPP1_002959 [Malassezia sp. CBS 17886]